MHSEKCKSERNLRLSNGNLVKVEQYLLKWLSQLIIIVLKVSDVKGESFPLMAGREEGCRWEVRKLSGGQLWSNPMGREEASWWKGRKLPGGKVESSPVAREQASKWEGMKIPDRKLPGGSEKAFYFLWEGRNLFGWKWESFGWEESKLPSRKLWSLGWNKLVRN